MKYVIHTLKDPTDIRDEHSNGIIICGSTPSTRQHSTEEGALKEATHLVRQSGGNVGIFKLIKTVKPPEVIVTEVIDEQ